MNCIGDLPQWHDVYSNAYRLHHRHVSTAAFNCTLFKSPALIGRDTWSTAPYLTDGGVNFTSDASWSLLANTLGEVSQREASRFILLKCREKLEGEPPHEIVPVNVFRTYLLNLRPGSEELFRTIKGSRRTEIRKATTHGADIVVGHRNLLDDFYQIVSTRWAQLGTPIHSKAFFRAILDAFGDQSRVMISRANGIPLGAALLIHDGETIFHPFAATLAAGNTVALNSFLYWNIIQMACVDGLKNFDLGRSRINQGTVSYKLSWGASEIPLYYYYYTKNKKFVPNLDSKTNHFLNSAWSRLPLSMTRALGPKLIRGVL